MANTAHLETSLKENAERNLAQLDSSHTYHFSAQSITKAEFDAELQKGINSIKNGRTHSVEDVDRMLSEEFGI